MSYSARVTGDRFIPHREAMHRTHRKVLMHPGYCNQIKKNNNCYNQSVFRALAGCDIGSRVLVFNPTWKPKDTLVSRKIGWKITNLPSKTIDMPNYRGLCNQKLLSWGAQNILSIALPSADVPNKDTIYFYRPEISKATIARKVHSQILSIDWNPDGSRLGVMSTDGLTVFDCRTAQIHPSLKINSKDETKGRLQFHGEQVLISGFNKQVSFVDLRLKGLIPITSLKKPFQTFSMDASKTKLGIVEDQIFYTYDHRKWSKPMFTRQHSAPIYTFQFLADNISCSPNYLTVEEWDANVMRVFSMDASTTVLMEQTVETPIQDLLFYPKGFITAHDIEDQPNESSLLFWDQQLNRKGGIGSIQESLQLLEKDSLNQQFCSVSEDERLHFWDLPKELVFLKKPVARSSVFSQFTIR